MLAGKELVGKQVVLESMKNVFYRGIYRGSFGNGGCLVLLSPAVVYGWWNKAEVKAVAINEDVVAYLYVNPSPAKDDPLNCPEVYGGEFLVKTHVENPKEFGKNVTVQTVKGEVVTGELYKLVPGEFVTLVNASTRGQIYRCKTGAVMIPWDNVAHINTPPATVEKIKRRNPPALVDAPTHRQKAAPMRRKKP